jgi:hypothetical protein
MIQPSPSSDPVLEEIHRTRQEIAAKFGFEIAAIMEDARKRQAASGRVEWSKGANDNPTQPVTSSPTQPTKATPPQS